MKMIWVFVIIGLAYADKLDRAYLPPPGSTLSEGTLNSINIPLEVPKSYQSISKTPELVIGIDRVSSNEADDGLDDISTHKPKMTYDDNSLRDLTERPSSGIKKTSPFFKQKQGIAPLMPDVTYGSVYQDINYKNPANSAEEQLGMSVYDYKNRVYLPSYGNDDKGNVSFIILPSPIMTNYEEDTNDEYRHNIIGSDIDSPKDMSLLNAFMKEMISSTFSPITAYDADKKIASNYDHSSTATQFSTNIPMESTTYNKVRNQAPERVQAQADRQATIINYEQLINPESYKYSYDTSNGIHGDEQGTTTDGVKAKGSYSYIGDDGNMYQVVYTADENGFVPKGAHLPTAPPIPDAILKVIEQAARDIEAGIYDDGSYSDKKYGYKKYQKAPHQNNIVDGDDSQGDIGFDQDEIHGNGFIGIGSTKNLINNYDTDNYNMNLPSKNIVVNSNYHTPSTNFILDNTDKINLHSGYEYFPPQYSFADNVSDFQQFPSRFSVIDNQDSTIKENNTDKVTAKPFLTPYVTRKGDVSEINDNAQSSENEQDETDYEEPQNDDRSEEQYQDIYSDVDDPLSEKDHHYHESNLDKPNDIPMNIDEEINFSDIVAKEKPGQHYEHNFSHLMPSTQEDDLYRNANKSLVTLIPRLSPTISTTDAPKFPTVSQSNKKFRGKSPSSLRPSLFNATPVEIPSSTTPISSLPINRATSTAILDTESTSANPEAFIETDLISRAKIITPVTDFLNLDVSLRLTTQSPSNIETATPKIYYTNGEDFTGPKQPQKFDPNTGYYY